MWYWASSPAPGKKLISVSAPLAPFIKDMAKAKELHEMRERQLGATTHSLHSASSLAFRNGLIDQDTLRSDCLVNKKGNVAKHGPKRKSSWADLSEDTADLGEEWPPLSGFLEKDGPSTPLSDVDADEWMHPPSWD
eukprot:2117939-Karenia_brevis.AAC.1